MITEDGRCIEDVKQRIGMAKDAFNKRRELLTRSMSKGLKKRMIKTLVWPVALYGSETWTVKKEVIGRLEAWIWRRMEKISWKDLKTNDEVLLLVGEERNLMKTIEKRKKN